MAADTILIRTTQVLRFHKKQTDQPRDLNNPYAPNAGIEFIDSKVGEVQEVPAWVMDDNIFDMAARPHPLTGVATLTQYKKVTSVPVAPGPLVPPIAIAQSALPEGEKVENPGRKRGRPPKSADKPDGGAEEQSTYESNTVEAHQTAPE